MAARQGTRNSKNKKKKPEQPVYQPPTTPPVSNPFQQAQREWDIANDAQFEEIARQGNQARDQFGESVARTDNIYGGLNRAWEQGQGQVQQDWGAAMRNLNQNFQGVAQANPFVQVNPGEVQNSTVAPMLAAEQQAYGRVDQSQRSGAMDALASMQASNAMYDQSIGRQAAYEQGALKRNYGEDYNDDIEALRQRRMDIFEDRDTNIAQRVDELRDQQFQQQLALGQYGLNERQLDTQDRQARFLRQWIMDMLDKKGGGNGGGGNPQGFGAGAGVGDGNGGGRNGGNGNNQGNGNNGGGNGAGFGAGAGAQPNRRTRLFDNVRDLGEDIYGEDVRFSRGEDGWEAMWPGYGPGTPNEVTDPELLKALRQRRRFNQNHPRRGTRGRTRGNTRNQRK